MERNRSGRSLAALLATLVLTCAVAHAQSDTPPTRRARLGLAIANLDQSWRDANSYRASGVMIIGVDPRGRAANSGIVAGDVLVSVGTRTMREPSDYGFAERSLSPDEAVSVVLARDGGRSIKVLEIPPVGAPPVMASATGFAQEPPAEAPAADPAPASPVEPTAAAVDTASQPAVTGAVAAPGSEPPPPAASTTPAAADTALPPATVTVMSAAAADTTTKPAPSSAPVTEPPPAAAPQSAASGAAPTLTAAGAAAASPTVAGSAGSPAATGTAPAPAATGAAAPSTAAGGATPGSVAPAAAAVIAAGAVAANVVEPGPTPEPETAAADSGSTPLDGDEPPAVDLGVVGKSLTPDLATAVGATGAEGILVLEVTAAGPADRSGLRAGDVILKVGDQPVADMGELQRAAAAGSSPLKVSTLRLGKPRLELVELAGPPPTPSAPPSQEQLLMELRDEVRSLRREVQSLRKKLGK